MAQFVFNIVATIVIGYLLVENINRNRWAGEVTAIAKALPCGKEVNECKWKAESAYDKKESKG